MQETAQPKTTPGRRRQNRNGTPNQAYASENDVANYHKAYSDSPATPQKSALDVPTSQPSLKHSQSANPKQRTKNQNKGARGKNGNANGSSNGNSKNDAHASPSQRRADHQSPAPSVPAFAGSTFQNSPAPSSLPIPSFLSRAVSAPDSPTQEADLGAVIKEPLSPTPGSEQEVTTASQGAPVPRHEESPLDFFFNADRAEKARARRASSANANVSPAGPFPPPQDSPQECNTFPRQYRNPLNRRSEQISRTSSGISASELDGTPGQPYLPAFSTPYQERLRAARSNSESPHSVTPTRNAAQNAEYDKSEALKRFLFSNASGGHSQPNPLRQHALQHGIQVAPPAVPYGHPPSSTLSLSGSRAQDPPNSSSASTGNSRADQLRSMEDTLRRALKLSPSP